MPPRLRTSGSGQGNTRDLSGAMNATRRLVGAMTLEADVAGGGEGSSGTDRGISNAFTPPPPYSELGDSTTHPPVERYVRPDGKIGVLISQNYQGSWSTRIQILLDPSDPASSARTRRMEEIALFDKEVVAAVLEGDTRQARTLAMAKMGLSSQECYCFEHVQLRVAWVVPGDDFEIADSPGFERVRLKNAIQFWRA